MELARHSDLTDLAAVTATLSAVQRLQQTQTVTYIALCSLTVSTWDWALTLGEEFQIVKRCRRSLAVFAYFVARATAVMLCVLSLVFLTKVPPEKNRCSALMSGIGLMAMTGSAAKAYLFLLRVRAVYDNSKLVKLVSGVSWLAVVCARMTIMFKTHTSYIEQTGHCAVIDMGLLPIFSIWLTVAYDTCIFISISARLTSHTTFITTPWIPSFVRGYGLPHTMRHLLHDGQFYYFINVIFASLAGVVAVSPVSPVYQSAFTWPAFAIEAIMTCKVFRAMILRSLHPARTGNVSFGAAKAHTTAMSVMELDTFLELRIRTITMSTEREQIW